MQDILPQVQVWLQKQQNLALATVVDTWRSAPRPIGAALVVNAEGDMLGSVSGGCVENRVVQEARKVMAGEPPALLHFGVTNEDAWEVGLSCGGKLDVLIEPHPGTGSPQDRALWNKLIEEVQADRGLVFVRQIGPGTGRLSLLKQNGELDGATLPPAIATKASEALQTGLSALVDADEQSWFLQTLMPRPRLLLIGSAHLTTHLIQLAHMYGFATTVIDPRDTFAKHTEYPEPPETLEVAWPQEALPKYPLNGNTYAVVLSHDPKIDDPALHLLLRSEVAYVGALGSKRTHARRVERLLEAGFSEAEISRIHAPVGLNIGARLPQEIALSVMAEIIQHKNLSA